MMRVRNLLPLPLPDGVQYAARTIIIIMPSPVQFMCMVDTCWWSSTTPGVCGWKSAGLMAKPAAQMRRQLTAQLLTPRRHTGRVAEREPWALSAMKSMYSFEGACFLHE